MKQIALLNVVGPTQSVDGLHRTKKKKGGERENLLPVPILKLLHSLILPLECGLQHPWFSGF